MPDDLRQVLGRFLASDHVGSDEVVEIAETGLCAIRDADGVLRLVWKDQLDPAGDLMPVVLALLDREGNEGVLDALAHHRARELAAEWARAAQAREAATRPRRIH